MDYQKGSKNMNTLSSNNSLVSNIVGRQTNDLMFIIYSSIIGSILLALSRAIVETMIVVMAAGMSAKLTANPFEAVTTVTVQIVTLLVGDQEFDNPKTLAAFALGLELFILTLFLNLMALRIVQKYREKYE